MVGNSLQVPINIEDTTILKRFLEQLVKVVNTPTITSISTQNIDLASVYNTMDEKISSIVLPTSYITNRTITGSINTITSSTPSLDLSNTNLIDSFTLTNSSATKQVNLVVVGTGKTTVTGVQNTIPQLGAFGCWDNTTKLFDSGWSRMHEDAKSCTFILTLLPNETKNISIRGGKDATLPYVLAMQFSIFGVA